ncbi:MAG: hypothetical protein ACR2GR_01260 [Rhodothermales bacterium]
MPVVDASILIGLPQEQMFLLTQDYYVRPDWDPFLRDPLAGRAPSNCARWKSAAIRPSARRATWRPITS